MGNMFVKVGNAHKKVTGAWVKIDGQWKKVSVAYSKIGDVWKPGWKNAMEKVSGITYPASITRGDKITWMVEEVTGAHYELQHRYNGGSWSASTFSASLTGTLTVSTNVSYGTFQMRVRAVAPVTRDKPSNWLEGPTRNLSPQKLTATAPTYTSTITRGDTVKVTINTPAKDSGITYDFDVIYYKGNTQKEVLNKWNGKNGTAASRVYEHTVTSGTDIDGVMYRIRASKTGYTSSDWANGKKVTLGLKMLGTPASITAPKPYPGQKISISWSAVTNAKQYQLDVQTNDGAWSRVYLGANRTFSYTVPTSTKSIQWRVRAHAPEYNSGNWKHSDQVNVSQPPLKTTTWTARKTLSWRDAYGGWRDDNDYIYQGSWDDGNRWGNHRGLAWFDTTSMRNTLRDKKIERVRIYFYRINKGGYVNDVKVNLHTHNYAQNYTGKPSNLYHIQGPLSSFDRGEGKWLTVDKRIAERIRDGSATGIALFTSNEAHYLYMSNNCKIEVQYR